MEELDALSIYTCLALLESDGEEEGTMDGRIVFLGVGY